MLQRVFDSTEIDGICTLKGPGIEAHRAEIARISKAKAVLATSLLVDAGLTIEVDLALEGAKPLALSAEVVESGEKGLFIRWQHPDGDSAARLQTALVECSCRERKPAPPPAPKASPKASAKAPGKAKNAPPKVASRKSPPAKPGSKKSAGDVPIDVQAAIRDRSRTVRSSELAARHDEVRVLSMGTILTLIQEAVDEAVQKMKHSLSEEERRRLREEAEEIFNERLEVFKAEKAGLEARTQTLQEQLSRAESLLEEEKSRVVSASEFTVSSDGMAELESRLGRILNKAVRGGGVSGEVEQEMRSVVERLLDDEREKIRLKAEEAQSETIDLLERKVQRLARSLEETEKARTRAERRAHALEAAGMGPGFRNMYDVGLEEDDPDREKKLALLKEIASANREVRDHMKEQGTVLRGRRRSDAAADATANDGAAQLVADGGATGEPAAGVKKITVEKKPPPPRLPPTGEAACLEKPDADARSPTAEKTATQT